MKELLTSVAVMARNRGRFNAPRSDLSNESNNTMKIILFTAILCAATPAFADEYAVHCSSEFTSESGLPLDDVVLALDTGTQTVIRLDMRYSDDSEATVQAKLTKQIHDNLADDAAEAKAARDPSYPIVHGRNASSYHVMSDKGTQVTVYSGPGYYGYFVASNPKFRSTWTTGSGGGLGDLFTKCGAWRKLTTN